MGGSVGRWVGGWVGGGGGDHAAIHDAPLTLWNGWTRSVIMAVIDDTLGLECL